MTDISLRETQAQFEVNFASNHSGKLISDDFKQLEPVYNSICTAEELEMYPFSLCVKALTVVWMYPGMKVDSFVNSLIHKIDDYNPQYLADALHFWIQKELIGFDVLHGFCIALVEPDTTVVHMYKQFAHPLPMVIKPLPIEGPYSTGYVTIRYLSVTNTQDPFFIENDVGYDALDKAASVALCVNPDIIASREQVAQEPVRSEEDTDLTFNAKYKSWVRFWDTAHGTVALMGKFAKKFYVVWRTDRRGRLYPYADIFNPQGTDVHKAFLELANGEVVSDEIDPFFDDIGEAPSQDNPF